jgi:hypothetical protein
MKTSELIDHFVKQANARKDGNAYLAPTDSEVTLFVVFPGDTSMVTKVSRIEIAEPFALVDTSRGERYVLTCEDIRGLKIEGARRDRGAAGFSSK